MTSEQPSSPRPAHVDAATLNFWHESLSVNEISEQLGIEPDVWYENGRSMKTGQKHVGNKCIITASGSSAVSELIARVRPQADNLRTLQEQGLHTLLACRCSPSKGNRLPSIDAESDQFLSDLRIDVLVGWREIEQVTTGW